MEFTYLGTDGRFCSVLKSNLSFEELNKKEKEGSLHSSDFQSCFGTDWNGIDKLERTLRLIPFRRTGRVIRTRDKLCFHGHDQDMWYVRDWTVSYDTFCEMMTTAAPGEDAAEDEPQYRGTVGKPWILAVDTIISTAKWGDHSLYIITDKQKNIFTCKCRKSLNISAPEGKQMFIKATVKRHVEYHGMKQTWLDSHPQVFYA